MPERPLPPGSVIGILGGGQLGRMLALAAARLGLDCHVYCPDPESPAFAVAAAHTVAAYEDEAALAAFANGVDVVTYEFENVPGTTAEFLAARVRLRPGARALGVCQDRLAEKRFVQGLGIGTAPFRPIDEGGDIDTALATIGLPLVIKTRRFGYDGKGQVIARSRAEAEAALARFGPGLIAEGFVPFRLECSAMVARGADGATVTYDVPENRHEQHILRQSLVPAGIAPATAASARAVAQRIAAALDYVGVLAVELFVTGEGEAESILVNELAPRVHNSFHWTDAVCAASQFEQHIRAVAGWPLGGTVRSADVTMENLIGDEADAWEAIAGDPDARLHLYGKRESRPGRKMGHVNRIRR